MARIDEAPATTARRILALDETPSAETGSGDDHVQSLLQLFYSLVQLTPDTVIPADVLNRISDRLSAASVGHGDPDTAGPEPPAPDSGESESAGPFARGEATQSPGRPAGPSTAVPRRAQGSAWLRALSRMLRTRIMVPVTALIMLGLSLVLSVTANVLLSRSEPFKPEAATYLDGTGSAPGARAVLLHDGKNLILHASGLAELASGYRYVAWHSSGNEVRYMGSLTMLSGSTARLVMPYSDLLQTVLVTIEPSASPSTPSGPRILTGAASR